MVDLRCMVESCSRGKEVFCRLPLPYIEEEFKVNITWKNVMENKMEPPPYIHIRRSVYLVKKKRDDVYDGIGCTNCSSICSDDCVCRYCDCQCISCSKACHWSEIGTNRLFRKEKKIKVIKVDLISLYNVAMALLMPTIQQLLEEWSYLRWGALRHLIVTMEWSYPP